MANRSLGVLTLDLIARIGGFEQGMDKAARTADKRMRDIEKRANAMGRAIGGGLRSFAGEVLAFVGVTASVGAAVASLKNAIDLADETRDMSIRLGESTETISAFRYAAQQTGTDIEALSKGMKILAKNAADSLNPTSEQAKVFDALGVKVTDSSGKLKALGVLIPEIADKFKTLQDGTTKAALAQALFGKSGLDLTEFLNQGADGLKDMGDRARELGIIIDSKTASAADDFNDTLGDLKSAASGLAIKVASDLLPHLQELAKWAVDFVKDGKNSADIAHAIADGFRDMVSVGRSIGELIGRLEQLRNVMAHLENVGHPPGVQRDNPIANFLKGKFPGLYKPIIGGPRDEPQVNGAPDNLFDIPGMGPSYSFASAPGAYSFADEARRAAAAAKAQADRERKIAEALSNPTGGSNGKKTGKSDAEKEAERLQAAYDRMNASLAEQIALFGQDGEAAKVRYDIEHGELQKLTQAQKDQLIAQAEKIDLLRAEEEAQRLVDEANERREKSVAQVLDDIRSEQETLGMTIEQLDTYNKLKWAGVTANDAWGASIVEANKALHEQAKGMAASIEFQDDWRTGLSDMFTDVVTGAKSAKDAIGGFFDMLFERATQAVADRWIEQLFGEKGSNGGGSFGDWFSALFGGGKAAGGGVQAGMFYQVNEQGPELLSVGGRDFLMMGAQGGHITPNRQVAAGAGVTQNIYVTGRVDNRTAQQIQREAAVRQRRALARS